jgi:hypothetical protein
LTKFIEVAGLEPKLTVESEVNPVPVTVTTESPWVDPTLGEIEATTGASM